MLNALKFKLKFKDGTLSLLYKNFKFDLWKKDNNIEAFGIVKNGYRFVIVRLIKDDIFQLSYSKNNYHNINIKSKVIYVDKNISNMNDALDLFDKTFYNLESLN